MRFKLPLSATMSAMAEKASGFATNYHSPVVDTGVYYDAFRWTLGYIFGKITDLEFEIHKNMYLYEFLAIKQAGTNIC